MILALEGFTLTWETDGEGARVAFVGSPLSELQSGWSGVFPSLQTSLRGAFPLPHEFVLVALKEISILLLKSGVDLCLRNLLCLNESVSLFCPNLGPDLCDFLC